MITKPISINLSDACNCDLVIAGTIAMGLFGIACIIFVLWQVIWDSYDKDKDFNWEMEDEQ